jgi:hypothetical protein
LQCYDDHIIGARSHIERRGVSLKNQKIVLADRDDNVVKLD